MTDHTPKTPLPLSAEALQLARKAAELGIDVAGLEDDFDRLCASADLVHEGWSVQDAACATGLRVSGGLIHGSSASIEDDEFGHLTTVVPAGIEDLPAWTRQRARQAADESLAGNVDLDGEVLSVTLEVVDADGERRDLVASSSKAEAGFRRLLRAARIVGIAALRPDADADYRRDAAADLIVEGWTIADAAAVTGLVVSGGYIHAGQAWITDNEAYGEWISIPETQDLEAWANEKAQEAADVSVGSGPGEHDMVIVWSYEVEIVAVDADGDHLEIRGYGQADDEPPLAEPDDGHEHEWCSPIGVVGGIKENPGVWGSGAGVLLHEVCSVCGLHRHTNTWDQSQGAEPTRTVRYEAADDASLRWVARRRVARGTWTFEHCPCTRDERAVGATLTDEDGEKLAACLWSDGELDVTSDGCGVFLEHISSDELEWPSYEDAMEAVWGDEDEDEGGSA